MEQKNTISSRLKEEHEGLGIRRENMERILEIADRFDLEGRPVSAES